MRRGSWTLRAKWSVGVVAVAVVPTVVLGLVVLDIQRAGLARAEQELEAAVVDEAASSLLAALDQTSDTAGRVARIFADQTIDPDARSRLIGDIVARAPAASGVAFFDEQRAFVDAVLPRDRRDDALRIPPAGQGFRVITLPDGLLAPRYEAPLEGPVRGFVVVGVAREAISARLREISLLRFGAPDRVHLVDEARHVLGGGAPGTPSSFTASGAFPTSFAAELLFTTELDHGGVRKVATVRTLPAQRWALVVERPTDEAFAALASARRAFFLSVAGLAVLAVAAALLLVRGVIGPIDALMVLVRRYGRREFAARSAVKSGDELEALGRSLETMADDLATSEQELERRTRIETNLRRYMPAEAADAATKDEGSLPLGGTRERVTVVFADVVAFTSFAESTSPERAVAFLNELFTMLSEIVFRHGGMVDKFIGDCVMAVFRASATAPDDVARALAAAEDMHAFAASNLPRWQKAYAFAVELGIGISTGEVLLGNLGSSSRMEYTVIGDAVNVAARLEALARPRQTLTTREVTEACPDLAFTSLGEHALRGRRQAIEVFEVTP